MSVDLRCEAAPPGSQQTDSVAAKGLDALVAFYEQLTLADVARFGEFYTEAAYFKDPFNEVRGVPAIERIFAHMFRQVEAPRFRVLERVGEGSAVMLVWEFHFRLGGCLGRRREQVMRGVSHLRLAADGRVCYHRDYWDTAEELYMQLPGLGLLLRGMRRALAA